MSMGVCAIPTSRARPPYLHAVRIDSRSVRLMLMPRFIGWQLTSAERCDRSHLIQLASELDWW